MKHFFQVTVLAHIEIPDKEFQFIKICCQHHYDYKVKSSVEVGGFLYGFSNRREFSKGEDKTLDLSFQEIDLILKSLEMSHDELSYSISADLRKIMQRLCDVSQKLNAQLLETSNVN